MEKKQLIIDTDCGIDDAQALMMALSAPGVQVLAITCVFGNAALDNVCQNVLRVLSVCERQGVSHSSPHTYYSTYPECVFWPNPAISSSQRALFILCEEFQPHATVACDSLISTLCFPADPSVSR